MITTLTNEIATGDQEIQRALAQDDAWATAAAYLASINGLGMLTTAWLLTATQHFALTPSPEAAANYVGSVPASINRERVSVDAHIVVTAATLGCGTPCTWPP